MTFLGVMIGPGSITLSKSFNFEFFNMFLKKREIMR